MSKIAKLLEKCAKFEKLATSTPMTLKACRSGSNFDFTPAFHGSLGPGYYFTTNAERAKKYAGMGGCIVWVELHFSNPLVGPKKSISQQLSLENHVDEDTGAYDYSIGGKITELAKQLGYDGIVAGESNGQHYEIVAFDKSSFTPLGKECANKEEK